MRTDMPVLRTQRIAIEPFRRGDEDALPAGVADPLVAQFAGLGWEGVTRDEPTRRIEEAWPGLRDEGRGASRRSARPRPASCSASCSAVSQRTRAAPADLRRRL